MEFITFYFRFIINLTQCTTTGIINNIESYYLKWAIKYTNRFIITSSKIFQHHQKIFLIFRYFEKFSKYLKIFCAISIPSYFVHLSNNY